MSSHEILFAAKRGRFSLHESASGDWYVEPFPLLPFSPGAVSDLYYLFKLAMESERLTKALNSEPKE